MDGWPGPCDVVPAPSELMSVVASPMFVDVIPVVVLLPLVELPPAVVPPPSALAPPDVETPIDDVVGKLEETAEETEELVAEVLATTKPLPRLMLMRLLALELLAVPVEPDWLAELDVAADPANDEPPATIDAAVLAALVRREPVACGGGVEPTALTMISPNSSGSESRPSVSSGS